MTKACHLPESSKVFHERAKEYDSWFDDSLLFEIETAAVRTLPIPMIAPALEIGVGPGRFADALGSGIGIDPALAPLHIARTRNIEVCQAIGEALPFCNNSVARVSLFFTLCFVQNPARVFHESYRILQDEGHFVLGFVPATSKWGKNLQQKKENKHPFYEHAHFFTVEEIKQLLKDECFTLNSSVSTLYQEPGEVTRIEPTQPGMDKDAGFVAIAATKRKVT